MTESVPWSVVDADQAAEQQSFGDLAGIDQAEDQEAGDLAGIDQAENADQGWLADSDFG